MRRINAWAILNENQMKVHAHYLPIYWLRRLAAEEAEETFESGNYRIVKVQIEQAVDWKKFAKQELKRMKVKAKRK